MNSLPTPDHRHENADADALRVNAYTESDARVSEQTNMTRRGFFGKLGTALAAAYALPDSAQAESKEKKNQMFSSPFETPWKVNSLKFGAKHAKGGKHLGEDMIVPAGTKVHPVGDGYLWEAGYSNNGTGAGGFAVVLHPVNDTQFLWSVYMHMKLNPQLLNNAHIPGNILKSLNTRNMRPEDILNHPGVQRMLQSQKITKDTVLGEVADKRTPESGKTSSTHLHLGVNKSKDFFYGRELPGGYGGSSNGPNRFEEFLAPSTLLDSEDPRKFALDLLNGGNIASR